jgi:transposase
MEPRAGLSLEGLRVKQPADHVTLSSEEGERLIAYVHQSSLPAVVAVRLEEIIRTCLWLVFALQESKITLKRLRRLLFGKSLKAPPTLEAASEPSQPGSDETSAGGVLEADAIESAITACATPPEPSQSPQRAKPQGGHRPGTGRLGADAYVGAQRVECRHDELAAGQRCPVCGQGTLYDLPPGVEIHIDGHALLSAIWYELHKLRCSACGIIFTASLPGGAGKTKYSPRARAVLVVSRYYLGLPFYRLEGYQAMQGVPVADATQWEQIEAVARCCYGVFGYLETLAAQGELIHQDDTTVRILTLMQENEQIRARAAAQGLSRATERTGMFTTALVVRVGERLIALYYSGRAPGRT